MSNETSISQDAVQFSDKTEKITRQKPLQDLIDSLRSVQDDIGQMSELSAEEKTLVAEFFGALLKLMQPLAATIAVSIEALPEELGTVVQANIDPTGHLAILHPNGQVELKNLTEEKNRDLMISVVEDIMPKFKQLTNAQKQKIEKRISFLSSITSELQKISKALSIT
jgi:hypothetical protein